MEKNNKLYRTKGRNHHLAKYDNGKVNYRWSRNKKTITDEEGNYHVEGDKKMTRSRKDGYDYTPLYQYLIKAVGRNFDDVCSEVYPRIENRSKIWDIVLKDKIYINDGVAYFALNDKPVPTTIINAFHHYYGSQNWSALYVDSNNVLQFVKKEDIDINGKHWYETPTMNGKIVNVHNHY